MKKNSIGTRMVKSTELGMSVCSSKARPIPICLHGRHENGWRKADIFPTRKKLMKWVDLGEPTSSLDHVYLGCTQRECKSNESIIDEDRKNVRITNLPVGATGK